MIYECLFNGPDFVIAKEKPWPWTPAERFAPFELYDSPEMTEQADDYQVTVNDQELWASQIDPELIGGGVDGQ